MTVCVKIQYYVYHRYNKYQMPIHYVRAIIWEELFNSLVLWCMTVYRAKTVAHIHYTL